MAGFFSKLFGGGNDNAPKSVERSEPESYDGLQVVAAPEPEGEQWRLSGFIIKPAEGEGAEDLERQFIRADTFPTRDDAVEWSLKKGRQIIDERGKRLFADGELTGRA